MCEKALSARNLEVHNDALEMKIKNYLPMLKQRFSHSCKHWPIVGNIVKFLGLVEDEWTSTNFANSRKLEITALLYPKDHHNFVKGF